MRTTMLALTARVNAARSAVKSATTDKAREAAIAELEAATKALATASTKVDSKSVSILKKEERYEEEDESEDEDEDSKSSKDEPKKPVAKDSESDKSSGSGSMSADEGDTESDSSDDTESDDSSMDEEESAEESADENESADAEGEDEEEDEDEDEKARASAIAASKAVLRAAKKSGNKELAAQARAAYKAATRAVRPKALSRLSVLTEAVGKVTGKKSLRAQLGALTALAANQATIEKLSEQVADLKTYRRKERVDALLKAARKDGKITSKERDSLRSDGLKLGTKWLKAHLDGRAKVRTTSQGASSGKALDKTLADAAKSLAPKDVAAEAEAAANAISVEGLTPDQLDMLDTFRVSAETGEAMDPAAFAEAMNKTLERRKAMAAAKASGRRR